MEVECGPVSLYSGGAGPCSVSVKDVEVQDLFGRPCKSYVLVQCSHGLYTVIIFSQVSTFILLSFYLYD